MTNTLSTADRRTNERVLRFGDNAAEQIPQIIRECSAEHVFCVADPGACEWSGAACQLRSIGDDFDLVLFSDFTPNPETEAVVRAVDACRQANPDLVLAIGGGAAIDIAKMARSFSMGVGSATDYMMGRTGIPTPSARLIAVPTTAGSGSEATRFAVGYVGGVKRSIEHPSMLPDIAVVDPLLCRSLPSSVTAASGLDAFCQAVESIWSVHATAGSLIDATEALLLAKDNLCEAHASGSAASRTAMSRAAYLAGCAINVTRTTICHALSYALTTERGVPHGAAVAATLSAMLRFNAAIDDTSCQDPQGAECVRRRIGIILQTLQASSVDEACCMIERLIASVNCYDSLQGAGLQSREEVSALVAKVNTERLANNPRRATPAELVDALMHE